MIQELQDHWRQHQSLRGIRQRLYGAGRQQFGSWYAAVLAAGLKPRRRKWSRELVIAELQRCHEESTSRDSTLCGMAAYYFGSLAQASQAAGVSVRKRTWTRECVIAAIQQRHSQGLPMQCTRCPSALPAAARKLFGTWHAAIRAAGLGHLIVGKQVQPRPPKPKRTSPPKPKPPKRWSGEKVIAELQRRLERDGKVRSTGDKQLTDAAVRCFGTWNQALDAAGIEPSRVKGGRWTKQLLIEAIQDYWQQHGDYWKGCDRLRSAAQMHFGSFRAAVEAAGLQPGRRRWSRESVIDELKRLDRAGTPITRSADRTLTKAAERRFGTWKAALDAAGVTVVKRTWDREHVIAELKRRHQEGLSLVSPECGPLARCAARCLGSWNEALEAAGLARAARRWTSEEVIAELQSRRDRQMPLSTDAHRRLTAAALVHFGSWREALMAAGIEAKRFRCLHSKDRVIAAIHDLWQQRGDLHRGYTSLYSAARKHFGSWHAAVAASGLQPPQQRWSQQTVIDELQRTFQSQGMRLSTNLKAAARQYFGTMTEARLAAGLPLRRRWSKEQVIAVLQDRYRQGLPLQSSNCDPALTGTARTLFGNWHAAIRAAGLGHLIVGRQVRSGRGVIGRNTPAPVASIWSTTNQS